MNKEPTPRKRPRFEGRKKRFFEWFSVTHFIACLLCVVGGAIFTANVKRNCDAMMQSALDVMHVYFPWIEPFGIASTAAGCLIIALSMLVMAHSVVSGRHENKDYDTKRVMTPVLLLMALYPAFLVWIFFFGCSVGFSKGALILEGVCRTQEVQPLWMGVANEPAVETETCETVLEGEDCVNCIDLYQFHFLFPDSARKEDMWLCGREVWRLCGIDLPEISRMWLWCLGSSVVVVFGVSLHLVALIYARTVLIEDANAKERLQLLYIKKKLKN